MTRSTSSGQAQGFQQMLAEASAKNDSLLCVGLDVDLDQMGDRDVERFCRGIIEATSDLVCAYKPNSAFYEALGLEGMEVLGRLRQIVPSYIPIIGDVKRGDIGNTSAMYAKAMFDIFGFDAITANPYGGFDALEPYLGYRDKGVLVWCRSSNPSAEDFQSLMVEKDGRRLPLYQAVAEKCLEWNTYGNVGLVVGATYPDELKEVRRICPDQVILLPAIGAQAGDLEAAVRYGTTAGGAGGAIISSSRQVIYASRSEDYASAARATALRLRDSINVARRALS